MDFSLTEACFGISENGEIKYRCCDLEKIKNKGDNLKLWRFHIKIQILFSYEN